MSAADSTALLPVPAAPRWSRPGAGEPPALAFARAHLNPAVVAATLLVISALLGRGPRGAEVALAAAAYGISFGVMTQPRLERIGDVTDWGRVFRHRTIEWLCVAALLLAAGAMLRSTGLVPRAVLLAWLVATPFLLTGAHAGARGVAERLLRRAAARRCQVIVGATRVAIELANRLSDAPWLGTLAGYFDDRRTERLPRACRPMMLGRFADLPDYARRNTVHAIYICLPVPGQPRVRGLLDALGDTTASIYFVPDLSAFDLMQARFGELHGMPLIAVRETPFRGMAGVLKRTSDVVLATAALSVALPAMAVIAFLIRRSSPGPVLFRQRRYGLDGREFRVCKFRTMTVIEDDAIHQTTRGDLRVTRIGRFLRRTSLDELPQLFNVIGGSMSLVGPRPHAVAHNEYYRKLVNGYMLRHKVRPGMTGLAQVNGLRGETATIEKMDRRVQFDLEYLKCWSIGLDVRILLKTARLVISDAQAY
jgi:putative colanic acid biosynthesis UDP-glucose lipid carrier transferase